LAEPESVERIADALEAVLVELIDGHEKLVALCVAKRSALSAAQHDRVAEILGRENDRVQQISELEKQRLRLGGELTLALDPAAAAPMRLRQLAERCDEPRRGRLLVLRQTLEARMRSASNEMKVARRATEALVRHMQGIVQTINSACAGAGVYGRPGTASAPTALSTFNTTA